MTSRIKRFEKREFQIWRSHSKSQWSEKSSVLEQASICSSKVIIMIFVILNLIIENSLSWWEFLTWSFYFDNLQNRLRYDLFLKTRIADKASISTKAWRKKMAYFFNLGLFVCSKHSLTLPAREKTRKM